MKLIMGKFYIDFNIDKNVFYTSPGITLVSKTCYQEIIYGPLDGASVSLDQPWPYKGRDPWSSCLRLSPTRVVPLMLTRFDIERKVH